MSRFKRIKNKSNKKSSVSIDEKIAALNKQLKKTGMLSEQPTMRTSNIYPQTSEVPNQNFIDFEGLSQGGYKLGYVGADGTLTGNADFGVVSGLEGVALSPPHPVTGVRNSAVHITSGLGNSTPLRPGGSTAIGFSDNPPVRTMGSALWFFDPNHDNGVGVPQGKWSNLEYGVEQGAWGFWDTVKSGQFTGLYIFNTDLSQHPSGDISGKLAPINFGTKGEIGNPTNILITQRGIGDINYHGPITPGRLFGLSDQGYNYLDGKSKRRLRKGTIYRTAGGGAYPTTGRTTTFTTGSRLQSAKDETGAPETPDTSTTTSSSSYNPQSGTMPDDFRNLPPEELGNIFSDPTSTEAQEAAVNIVSNEIKEKPELASKFEQFGKAGETFFRYLTGTLPDVIDNEFLGQEYVNSMIAAAEPFHGDGVGNKLVFGDNILGTTQEPIRQGNTITVDFNYDFKTNAEELKGKEDQLNFMQRTFGEILANAFGPYSIDGSPKAFGPVLGGFGNLLDLVAGGFFSKFIETGKALGGAQHRPGKLTMDLSQIASENPKLLRHLLLKGLITGEEFTALEKGESLPEYNPASEENFEYNKPSWFTFAYRTADGRIYGYNFSGAFGELKLAGSRGERGSMESGYGTRGYDPKTNSGGTPWTMVYDGTSMWDKPGTSKPKSDPKPDPKPKPKPQGGRGGGQGNPTNKRGSGFPKENVHYKSKSNLLSEAAKLGHFEPDILKVDIEDIRKGIMPEFPKKPPAEMIDGYHQDSKLKPKELNKEPFLKIDEKDLIRNHRLKPNEAQEMMQTIDRINDHIKKHPEDLIHAQMRYPVDDPRLAELNWKMDQMLDAGEEYLDSNFKVNDKLFKRAVDRTKNNIKLTDPEYVQQNYDELRGTTQGKVINPKPRDIKLKSKLKKHLPQYESKSFFKHVDSKDFKKISERKEEQKRLKLANETALNKITKERQEYIDGEMSKQKSDWRKDISESDFTNITKGNKVGQTFQHVSGATITLDNTMSDPSDRPSQVTLDLGGDEKITVDAPSENEYGLTGVTKPLDKKVMQKQSVKTAKEINDQLDASEKASESKSARVPIETGDLGYKSTDEILDEVGDQWTYEEYMAMLDAIADKAAAAEEPIAKAIAEYSPTGSTPGDVPISLIDAQEAITNARHKAEQALHQAWERYNKVPDLPSVPDESEEGISSDDIKFLNKQQTLVNLTKGLGAIGLPNDFAQWTINYAKGDMKPITKFSPGMERQVRNLVLDKFKKNPNAKTVDIQYGDYGFGAKALSTRLGLGRFNATKLDNGKIRIQDTFNVDKDFTTIGFADIVPGLQKTADRLVDISYKTRNIKGRTDEGGIKIDVLIDSGFVKKKRGSAFNKIKKMRNK